MPENTAKSWISAFAGMPVAESHVLQIRLRLDFFRKQVYIYLCMKTTIDIADNILQRCKRVSRLQHVSFRSLVEEGLSIVLDRHEHPKAFSFNPVTFDGKGLREELRTGSWQDIRKHIYEGHGD